jgi:uncharacterized protein YjdB
MNVIKFSTMKKVFLYFILGLACTIGMTGCGEENKEPGDVPLTGITADRDDISLNVRYSSASDNVRYAPVPANATDVRFVVSSKDPSVATVEETALGTARVTVLKTGSTAITITSGSVTKEIPVTGRFDITALTEIRLELPDREPEAGTDSTMTFSVPVGEVVEVKATANPRNANTATTDYVVFDWTSNNQTVATVAEDADMTEEIDKTGKITVTGAGEARITISWSGTIGGEPTVVKAKTIIIKGV